MRRGGLGGDYNGGDPSRTGTAQERGAGRHRQGALGRGHRQAQADPRAQ